MSQDLSTSCLKNVSTNCSVDELSCSRQHYLCFATCRLQVQLAAVLRTFPIWFKSIREYGQEILQSYIADQPTAPRGRDTELATNSHMTPKDKIKRKTAGSLFPSVMIAKLETTLLHNKTRLIDKKTQNNKSKNIHWIVNNRTIDLECPGENIGT